MMTPEIKQLFSEAKTSPLRVARDMGVTHTYVYGLIDGYQRNADRRQQLADALGVEVQQLASVCGWVR